MLKRDHRLDLVNYQRARRATVVSMSMSMCDRVSRPHSTVDTDHSNLLKLVRSWQGCTAKCERQPVNVPLGRQ
jgi:hypothetical protein